jgi:hypothetical protein
MISRARVSTEIVILRESGVSSIPERSRFITGARVTTNLGEENAVRHILLRATK